MIEQVMEDVGVMLEVLRVVNTIKKPIQLSVGPDKHYLVDLQSHQVTRGKAAGKPVELALEFKEQDFDDLVQGKLKPMQAFMQGKIKAKGNLSVLMKFQPLQPKLEKIRDRQAKL